MQPIIAIVGLLVTVGVACGQDAIFTWTGEGGDDLWTTSDNWRDESNNHGVPDAGDRAVLDGAGEVAIIEGTDSITVETIEISNASAGILIEADGDDNGSLTLTNHACILVPTCTYFNSELDGEIELEDEATLAFTTGNHTFTGTGAVVSDVDNTPTAGGGNITIAASIFFRNGNSSGRTAIQGAFRMTGAGKFINDGSVEAVSETPGDTDIDYLIVDVDTIEDTEDAIWLTNCEAQLRFKNNACLLGDFDDVGITSSGPGGSFAFDDSVVHTRGTYIRLGCGDLSFFNDGEFAFGAQDTADCDVNTSLVSGTCDEEGDIKDADADSRSNSCGA